MFHTLFESPFITASFVLHLSFNSSFSHYYHQRCQRMLSGHVAETVAKGWQNKVCSLSHVTIICGRVHFSLTAVPVLDNPDSDSHLPEMRHVLTLSISCPVLRNDQTLAVMKNGQGPESFFRIQMFKFVGSSYTDVFLHCNVQICHNTEGMCQPVSHHRHLQIKPKWARMWRKINKRSLKRITDQDWKLNHSKYLFWQICHIINSLKI